VYFDTALQTTHGCLIGGGRETSAFSAVVEVVLRSRRSLRVEIEDISSKGSVVVCNTFNFLTGEPVSVSSAGFERGERAEAGRSLVMLMLGDFCDMVEWWATISAVVVLKGRNWRENRTMCRGSGESIDEFWEFSRGIEGGMG
jgi:hypothetical protein